MLTGGLATRENDLAPWRKDWVWDGRDWNLALRDWVWDGRDWNQASRDWDRNGEDWNPDLRDWDWRSRHIG